MSDTALAIIEAVTPEIVFRNQNGAEDIVSRLEREVRAIPTDATTEKGRKHIKSVAYQVARSKTALDDMGKQVKADAMALVKSVDADRRVITGRFDALRDEIRAPVDEYEAREAARVDAHKAAIHEIEGLSRFDFDPSEDQVNTRFSQLHEYEGRDWQEFGARGSQAFSDARSALADKLEIAKVRRLAEEERQRREAAEAEQARIAAEEARKAREVEIARVAAEQARRRAEAEAAERVAKIEREAREREERISREQVEALERAKREQAAAIERERSRVAKEAAAKEAEDRRRAADREHRATVNRAALAAILNLGVSDDAGRKLVAAIASGKIPHISIQY